MIFTFSPVMSPKKPRNVPGYDLFGRLFEPIIASRGMGFWKIPFFLGNTSTGIIWMN